jgi:hypothetical protein
MTVQVKKRGKILAHPCLLLRNFIGPARVARSEIPKRKLQNANCQEKACLQPQPDTLTQLRTRGQVVGRKRGNQLAGMNDSRYAAHIHIPSLIEPGAAFINAGPRLL